MRRLRASRLVISCMLVLAGSAPALRAETPGALDSLTVKEQRALDARFVESHDQKSTDLLMSLFSESPNVFLIAPAGILFRGRKGVRDAVEAFFNSLEYIHGEIKDVSYLPAGDGVIGVGTVVFQRKPKGRPPEQKTVIWTDYRRREREKWVYVFRHAHWPLETRR